MMWKQQFTIWIKGSHLSKQKVLYKNNSDVLYLKKKAKISEYYKQIFLQIKVSVSFPLYMQLKRKHIFW